MVRFLLIACLAIGCTPSTEQKLKEAVTAIEKHRLASYGEAVESLTVDSLRYGAASMRDFYASQATKQLMVLSESSQLLATAHTDAKDRLNVVDKLQALSDAADTAKNLYWVKYYVKARTDKNTYGNTIETYLSHDGLKEIKLDKNYFKKGL